MVKFQSLSYHSSHLWKLNGMGSKALKIKSNERWNRLSNKIWSHYIVITGKDTVNICKLFLVRKKYEMNYSRIGQVKFVEDIYKISLLATLSNISLLIKLPMIFRTFFQPKGICSD